jgi:hypothetical protein
MGTHCTIVLHFVSVSSHNSNLNVVSEYTGLKLYKMPTREHNNYISR